MLLEFLNTKNLLELLDDRDLDRETDSAVMIRDCGLVVSSEEVEDLGSSYRFVEIPGVFLYLTAGGPEIEADLPFETSLGIVYSSPNEEDKLGDARRLSFATTLGDISLRCC